MTTPSSPSASGPKNEAYAPLHGRRDAGPLRRNLREGSERLSEPALAAENGADDGADADEHDDTLNEVIDSRRRVAAENDIHSGQNSHREHTPRIADISESHAEQP